MARFAIAGAGIAGLCTALALGRNGHDISIFERRTTVEEAGAGLQLSPNATRPLTRWGILPALEAVATEPECLVIRRGADARAVATVPLGHAARARFGFPSLLLHRADLQAALMAAASGLRNVTLASGVAVARADPSSGTLHLSGPAGETVLVSDGLIRADGVHAPTLDGRRAVFSGKTAWRALVPATDLPAEFTSPRTNLWLGRRAHIVHYPLRRGTVVNLVVIVDGTAGTDEDEQTFWSGPGDPDLLRAHLRGWHALPRLLTERVAHWQTWPLLHRRGPVRWSDGRMTAVGDAAHPMLPFLAQGASQAVEDAAALAAAVAATPGCIPDAFKAYERRRAPRATEVQRRSERQGRIYHLSGPAAVARDTAMALLGPDRLLAGMDWLYAPDQS